MGDDRIGATVLTPASPAMRGAGRIHVLDVLRGIALLGMFLVHFSDFSSGGGRVGDAYKRVVALLFEERFWTMFGILFGVGFAIQLRRADARGEPFVAKYLRRMAALAVFGFIAHAVFGFNVLLGYAAWGVPLLLVRTWPIRALIVALVLSAISWNVYATARISYGVWTKGEAAFRADEAATTAKNRTFITALNQRVEDATAFPAVFAGRLQKMRWFYAQPFSWLPVNTLTLFLLGVLGLRLGLFERPGDHRRLIHGLMIFGLISWALSAWVLPLLPNPSEMGLVRALLVRFAAGFGLIRGMWLAFTYIGLVLLLVARNPAWLRRLAVFGWTGRMALTNYMIQIAILDLCFAKYALGLQVTPLVGLAAALVLFGVDAAFSRWWLARFQYGPLEWLWRSITQARWQSWRVGESVNA